MIIKLIEVLPDVESDSSLAQVLYVNVAHIETMWVNSSLPKVGTVTVLEMASGEAHWVREGPEQIVNM